MNKHTLTCFITLTLLAGCGFKPNKVETPRWTTEILAPLVKAPLSPEEVIQLKEIKFGKEVKMSDAGIPNGTYPLIPPIPSSSLPAYVIPISADVASITFESGTMKMIIQNNLPINVKAGTVITIQTGTTVFFTHTLPTNINPGDTYEINPEYDVTGKTITENVTLKITNFSSDGKSGSVTINGSEKLSLNFVIKNLKVQKIGLASNNQIELADTSNFSIAGSVVKTGEISGKFVLFSDNQMPIQVNAQGYFLDSTKKVIDSLFVGTQLIGAATVDGSGFSNSTNTSSVDIPFSIQKFEKIKPAKYFKSYVKVSTGSGAPVVYIRSTDKLTLQLVADIKIKIENKTN
ncbi:MAG: hypothetical protein NZ455_15675 [Bacteroidia bacterium]|nr:hypothetical protein [Bacteroidia bacterium]MDW8347994.1 hypothetical protein [Bacteroidia bacterium]